MSSFTMIWSSVLASACYCYTTAKLVRNGALRFLMFLPVICLFFLLPLKLTSVTMIIFTSFSLTWLATFKLLLLVFHNGPLSNPSLSLPHFALILYLPIQLKHTPSPKSYSKRNTTDNSKFIRSSLSQIAKKGLIVTLLLCLSPLRHKVPRVIYLYGICTYIYASMDVFLTGTAVAAQILLGTEVEPSFMEPYLATSLQDFWGRRWNRPASSILRLAIFDPTRHHVSRALGRKRAAVLALLVTFIVSDLIHEIIFYYLGRVKPEWGTPLFFLAQLVPIIAENELKKKVGAKWRLPQMVSGPLCYGYVTFSFMWLALPALMQHNPDDKVLAEYSNGAVFFKDWIAAIWK